MNRSKYVVIPIDTDDVCILPWDSENCIYSISSFHSHKTSKRISEERLIDALDKLIDIPNYDVLAFYENYDTYEGIACIILFLTIIFFILCFRCVMTEMRKHFKNKLNQRNYRIDCQLEEWNVKVGKSVHLNLSQHDSGFYLMQKCDRIHHVETKQKQERLKTFENRTKVDQQSPGCNIKIDKSLSNGSKIRRSFNRCNTKFGHGNKDIAFLCTNCTLGNKKNDCVCCGKQFGYGDRKQAFLCNDCGSASKQPECVKCGRWFGNENKEPAFLCHDCRCSIKKNFCCKMT